MRWKKGFWEPRLHEFRDFHYSDKSWHMAGKESMKKWHVHLLFYVMPDKVLYHLDQRLQTVSKWLLKGDLSNLIV